MPRRSIAAGSKGATAGVYSYVVGAVGVDDELAGGVAPVSVAVEVRLLPGDEGGTSVDGPHTGTPAVSDGGIVDVAGMYAPPGVGRIDLRIDGRHV